MNKLPENEIIVLSLAGALATVMCKKSSAEHQLSALGFAAKDDLLSKNLADDSERRQIALGLIHLDALFSGGSGWSPAELMAFYREQGLITDTYRTIAWRSPDAFIIESH